MSIRNLNCQNQQSLNIQSIRKSKSRVRVKRHWRVGGVVCWKIQFWSIHMAPSFVCLELSEDSTRKFAISCRRDYGADDGIGGDKSD
jgi:hypothetical protein